MVFTCPLEFYIAQFRNTVLGLPVKFKMTYSFWHSAWIK